jgi:hypothetical protein
MHRTIPSVIVFVTLAIFAVSSFADVSFQFAQFHTPSRGQPFNFTNNGGVVRSRYSSVWFGVRLRRRQ